MEEEGFRMRPFEDICSCDCFKQNKEGRECFFSNLLAYFNTFITFSMLSDMLPVCLLNRIDHEKLLLS